MRERIHDSYFRAKPRRPAILLVHGGGWNRGSHLNQNFNGTDELARYGFEVTYSVYRLATSVKPSWPAVLWDVQRAITQLRARGFDDVTVIGTSAGANLALLSTMHYEKKFAATGRHEPADRLILLYGVYDYSQAEKLHSVVRQGLSDYTGRPVAELARQRWMNPVNMELPAVPVLLIHGDEDTLVPVEQTYALEEALYKQNPFRSLETLIVDGGQHGLPVMDFERNILEFIRYT